MGKQEIDIFSPQGRYLYHVVIELPEGLQRIRPFVFKGKYLYALVKSKKGDHKLIKYEIRKPEDFDIKNQHGGTLLHSTAGSGSVQIIQTFLDRGFKINEKDRYGWTLLHYAVEQSKSHLQ